jgi:hypothetical protein
MHQHSHALLSHDAQVALVWLGIVLGVLLVLAIIDRMHR